MEQSQDSNNERKLSECHKSMFDEDQFKDFKLIVGKDSIMVHKVILSNRCAYFKKMLLHDTKESQVNEVVIEDFEFPIIKSFVKYLYTDEVEGIDDYGEQLMVLADKYDMQYLKERCEKHLIGKINSANAVDYLIVSDNYNCKTLREKALSVIKDHIRLIKKSESLKKLRALPHLYEIIIDYVFPDEEESSFTCVRTRENPHLKTIDRCTGRLN